MKRFVYFVSYTGDAGKSQAWGSSEIFTDVPITTYQQIRTIEKGLASKDGFSNVVLINFQLLREEEV